VQRPRAATLSLPDLFPLDAQGDMDIDEIDLASDHLAEARAGGKGERSFNRSRVSLSTA